MNPIRSLQELYKSIVINAELEIDKIDGRYFCLLKDGEYHGMWAEINTESPPDSDPKSRRSVLTIYAPTSSEDQKYLVLHAIEWKKESRIDKTKDKTRKPTFGLVWMRNLTPLDRSNHRWVDYCLLLTYRFIENTLSFEEEPAELSHKEEAKKQMPMLETTAA